MKGLAEIEAMVLAGGLGTRLRGVLPDAPKVLAPVMGRPFLDHLLDWLAAQGVRRVVLGLGYRAADVLAYLQTRSWAPLEIRTVTEPEPLGTGGAVALARPMLSSDPVLVINGDTIVDADLSAFLAAHRRAAVEASMLCAEVGEAGRYGRLEIAPNGRIMRFEEKDPAARGPAWINAGYYLFGAKLLDRIAKLSKGSLERDTLESMPSGAILAFRTRGRFLDIGTPETLAVAAEILKP